MNKEELQKKCADLIGVSTSEKALAFELLQEKILEQLKKDSDALKIPKLGVFQLKQNTDENTNELIYSPMHTESGSKTFFLRLPVKITASFNDDTVVEDIFSLSVGKPTVPLKSFESGAESDSSFVYIKKRIEERVNEILSDSELLNNFNLWDDYLKIMKKHQNKRNVENESSSLLNNLNKSEPEKEEDLDPFIKSTMAGETEFYSYPEEEELPKEEEYDELFSDFETFKNLTEHENPQVTDDSEILDSKTNPDESEQPEIEPVEPEEKDETEPGKPKEVSTQKDNSTTEIDDDVFDLDKSVFETAFDEGDKVDWNWGDELKSEIPEDVPPVVKKTKIVEEETTEPEDELSEPEEKIEEDPFGTLEQTLEHDPEFISLTSERFSDDIPDESDREYRITNLSKPREVPPAYKTRITRLTSPVEEEDQPESKTKEKSYQSFRDRNSNSNLFVIGGIIVILVVIIYFAFSIGDSPSKEVLKPSNETAQTKTEENIVTSQSPVTTPVQSTQESAAETSNKQDNSSQVEEIRISNLIFRRGNEYNVQVSSWRSSIKASEEVKRLKAKGYNAFSIQAYLPSKGGTWHRVRIGGFKSEEQARNFLNNTQL